jgi:hypothetical protein
MNLSQKHECGNWDRDPDIPFLGIFVSKFRYFVFAVYRLWGGAFNLLSYCNEENGEVLRIIDSAFP